MLAGGDTTEEGLIRPTVIANPSPTQGVLRRGLRPGLTITQVGSLDEAIELANATRFGLQAGIFTRDIEARRCAPPASSSSAA